MEPQHYLTSLSILVALATAVAGYVYQEITSRRRREYEERVDRRRQTFEFLRKVVEEEGLIHNTNVEFAKWIRDKKPFDDDEVEDPVDEKIVRMLDFYDLVAYAAIEGVIDEEVIVTHLGGRMRSTHDMLERYITDRRKRIERDGLYQFLERFVIDRVGDRDV